MAAKKKFASTSFKVEDNSLLSVSNNKMEVQGLLNPTLILSQRSRHLEEAQTLVLRVTSHQEINKAVFLEQINQLNQLSLGAQLNRGEFLPSSDKQQQIQLDSQEVSSEIHKLSKVHLTLLSSSRVPSSARLNNRHPFLEELHNLLSQVPSLVVLILELNLDLFSVELKLVKRKVLFSEEEHRLPFKPLLP